MLVEVVAVVSVLRQTEALVLVVGLKFLLGVMVATLAAEVVRDRVAVGAEPVP